MSIYIAPYVLLREYECHHCHTLPPEVRGHWLELPIFYCTLFDEFKYFREAWGKPVNISSGYRCVKHNKTVGGVDLSLHIFGGALDMKFRDDEETVRAAQCVDDNCSDLRMGVYLHGESRLHVDVAHLVIPRLDESWTIGLRWGDTYA